MSNRKLLVYIAENATEARKVFNEFIEKVPKSSDFEVKTNDLTFINEQVEVKFISRYNIRTKIRRYHPYKIVISEEAINNMDESDVNELKASIEC